VSRGKTTWIDNDLVRSKAFEELHGTAIRVYLVFLGKRKMQKLKGTRGRAPQWIITNDGNISFTYDEAKRFNINPQSFAGALDKLVETGFIDISHLGSGGVKGDKSTYTISERWRKYGTAEFVQKKRPKDTRKGRGFSAYHEQRRKVKTEATYKPQSTQKPVFLRRRSQDKVQSSI